MYKEKFVSLRQRIFRGNRITIRCAHRDPVGGGETIENQFSLRENILCEATGLRLATLTVIL